MQLSLTYVCPGSKVFFYGNQSPGCHDPVKNKYLDGTTKLNALRVFHTRFNDTIFEELLSPCRSIQTKAPRSNENKGYFLTWHTVAYNNLQTDR